VAALAALATGILLLPGFVPVASGPAGGRVLVGILPGTTRPGFVYLPPKLESGRQYPVVYLLHGMPGSPSEYLDGTDLAAFADEGIATGRLRPFIAVAPAAGPDRNYNGEWAGPLESALVGQLVPWVDRHLPTIRSPAGRLLAGLSAGGFGAADIGLRNPEVFGTILSWSGYFQPLRDGPFKHATKRVLAENDPVLLASEDRDELLHDQTRFFVSTGPAHSHWFTPAETYAFARELRRLGLPVTSYSYPQPKGEWRAQLDAGLTWALGQTGDAVP
jgi:enterochelin esterase-like enzyme